MIDVRPTVEIIYEMANELDDYADNLRSFAKDMQEKDDISYVIDVINTIKNMNANLRTDLLIARPLREFMK